MRTVLSRGRMVEVGYSSRYLNVGTIKQKLAFVFSSGSCQQVAGSAGSSTSLWLPFFTFVLHSQRCISTFQIQKRSQFTAPYFLKFLFAVLPSCLSVCQSVCLSAVLFSFIKSDTPLITYLIIR